MAKIYGDMRGYASYKLIIKKSIISGICRDMVRICRDMIIGNLINFMNIYSYNTRDMIRIRKGYDRDMVGIWIKYFLIENMFFFYILKNP